MEEKSIAQEITAKLQKKYGRVIEIGRLTDELTEALSRNDKQSVNIDRKSTRLNSSHVKRSRMPSSA